jgi:hypothetical protein
MAAAVVIVGVGGIGVEDTTVVAAQWAVPPRFSAFTIGSTC